jgi:translin
LTKRSDFSVKLERLSKRMHRHLSERDSERESCLRTCREIIRLSSGAIRSVHRREKDHSIRMIDATAILVNQISHDLKTKHNELLYANYVHDAFKEYAEACITCSIVLDRDLPDPDSLGIAYPAFLNGLAESVGELRRYALDGLRGGDFASAERLLDIMDQIYSVLVTMDFPDAITYGLRRSTDSVRGIVEKTRGDLTLAESNNLLQQKIADLTGKLGNSKKLI